MPQDPLQKDLRENDSPAVQRTFFVNFTVQQSFDDGNRARKAPCTGGKIFFARGRYRQLSRAALRLESIAPSVRWIGG